MVKTFDEIKDLINSVSPAWVDLARKEEKKLNVHINGIGTAEYLKQIDGIENDRQYQLRIKTATSNKYIFENILRPVDKVFSANGGSTTIKTKTEQSQKILAEKLQNFNGGFSLRKWIEVIQSGKYYGSPSGLLFFEWKDKETWPTFKSIHAIKNYSKNGRKIDWVLFEGEKRKDETGKEKPGEYFRFVDDAFDYLFYKLDTNIQLIEDETFENPFGFVPAITNSNIYDSTLTYNISPVDSVIELADHYLRTNSVKNIYEFLHGYPIFWAIVESCRKCDGTGLYDGETCTKCNGDGHTFRKDVSDVLKIKPPRTNDDPKIAPDIAGYIQPDLETWREQRIELEWLYNLMSFAIWGTTQERAENETATGAFIDVQPVNDRLNKFADAYEQTEHLCINIVGTFYIRENYEFSSVNYGRRFLVEPPDKIWEKYQKAKVAGSPKETLDYLLVQFYQSEFKDDKKSLAIALKGIDIEPFVHKTDEEINSLPVSDEDKKRKFYFNEFWKTVDTEIKLLKSVDELNKIFDEFILTKNLKEDARQETPGMEGDRV